MAHPLNRPRFDAARGRVVDGYGILQPRVGVEPAEREPLALRAAVRRRAGHRSVHARGLRRLPGPVRRRLVHRQGHLRRRRLRARARRTLAREPHPQPRPARRLLRALGPAERRAAVRGLPVALRRRREPAPPLDPRRLADRAAGCCRACRARRAAPCAIRSRALSRWKILDNLRRSLVPAALRRCCCSAGWSLPPRLARGRWRCWRSSSLPPLAASLRRRCSRKPRDVPLRQHLRRRSRARPARRPARSAAFTLACLPYEAYFSLDAIVRTLVRACSSRAGGCSNGRPSSDAERSARHRTCAASCATMWIAPGARASPLASRSLSLAARTRCRSPRRCCCCGSLSPAARLVAQPAARRAAAARCRDEQIAVPAHGWRAGPGRSSRPSSAPTTTGCRPTTSRSIRRAVVAHRTSPTNIGLSLLANLAALRLRLHHRPAQLIERTDAHARARWTRWSATAATSTTGTTRRRCSRCGRVRLDGRQRQPRRPPADAARRACWSWPTQPMLPAAAVRRACATRCDVLLETLARGRRGRAARVARRARAARAALARIAHRADAELAAPASRSRATPQRADDEPTLRWADALDAQCRGARDELPRARAVGRRSPPRAGARASCATRSRARRCATLAGARRAARARRRSSDAATRRRRRCRAGASSRRASREARRARARERIAALERARAARRRARRHGLRASSTTARATCSRSATTSTSAGCDAELLRPARLRSAAAPASSRSRRASCRRSSWFALGRLLTDAGGEPALLSWSGSMFEYLMPLLVMPTLRRTRCSTRPAARVGASGRSTTARERGVPWGISESGYNTVDAQLNYQYRAFGVPGPRPQARPRRGPGDRAVRHGAGADGRARGGVREPAAPGRDGLRGRYGFYEAIDYTPSRLPRGQDQRRSCARSWRITRA